MNVSSEQKPVVLWQSPWEPAEQDCACSDMEFANQMIWSPLDEQGEDDCACPGQDVDLLARPEPGLSEGDWQLVAGLYRAVLSGEHELVFNPLGLARLAVLNQPARQILDAFVRPGPLTNQTARQLADLGFLQPRGVSTLPPRFNPKVLTAWLHVTNACNMSCSYCYVQKTGEDMDEATGRAALEAVFRSAVRYGIRRVKLKYGGGEATLNFGLVRLLHQHAVALASQMRLGLCEVVLSNGVALSDSMLDFIGAAGMRLMISLDGIGQAHDAQRYFVNGRSSFALVARGIERALRHQIQPYLSVTITGQNADRVADVVAFALDRDLLFNLNFYRDNDYSRRLESLAGQDELLIAGVRRALALIEERLPRQSLIAALIDRSSFGAPHEQACGAGRNYLVIDQRGQVARCQMEIERTVADVFQADPLAAVRGEVIGFHNVPVDQKEDCRQCQWRYWCAGGCSLLTYRLTGRSDVKSPYCNVYKALYPDLLRLEGLRLLKWHRQAN